MKKIFNKVITRLKESGHYKHFLGGLAIGLFANSTYCAFYTGIGVALAIELKDKSWGGDWDWYDIICTIVGTVIGRTITTALLHI